MRLGGSAFLCLLLVWSAALPASDRTCTAPVCITDPDSLRLTRLITFDDLPSSPGIGRQIDEVLIQPGARFGERFLGQTLQTTGPFDIVTGTALPPLTAIAGNPGQTLGVIRLIGTTVLHGHGARGFPRAEAVGEGAISVLFDTDQSAFGFDIRGGEQGSATLTILRRDGQVIDTLTLGPLAEQRYGFLRRDNISDIAGFVLVNTDPEGLSLDNLRFERDQVIGALAPTLTRPRG